MTQVFLIGVPQPCGGGNVEGGETALLWRRMGIEVTCLYFSNCRCGRPVTAPHSDANPWVRRLTDAGVRFVAGTSDRLREVPGLAGSTLSAFCVSHAMHNWPEMAGMGCRIVWSPCMTYFTPAEAVAFHAAPPTMVHFQSRYQRQALQSHYETFGCRDFATMPGVFWPLEFLPRRYCANETFVIGRLARADRTKWSKDLWSILGEVRSRGVSVHAMCQGWGPQLSEQCGTPPSWASCFPERSIHTPLFLLNCHVLMCCNREDTKENWPRVGLEAMSAGVPLVVDDSGGWPEQIGDAGLLCNSPAEYVDALVRLGTDEAWRQELIARGEKRILEIADPEALSAKWMQVFSMVSG